MVLYAREGIGDIVYSDRQSQLHMDLEVYMREDDDHRGLRRLTGDDGKSYPAIKRERGSLRGDASQRPSIRLCTS